MSQGIGDQRVPRRPGRKIGPGFLPDGAAPGGGVGGQFLDTILRLQADRTQNIADILGRIAVVQKKFRKGRRPRADSRAKLGIEGRIVKPAGCVGPAPGEDIGPGRST